MVKEARVKPYGCHLKMAETEAEFIMPLRPEERAGLGP